MGDAKIIKNNHKSIITKTFQNQSWLYEHLKVGDVIEVEEGDGNIADYYVTSMYWDFTHFGDTLVIEISPVNI